MACRPTSSSNAYSSPKKMKKGLRWRIETKDVEVEMARQGVDKIDFKFCLQWHANEFHTEGKFYKDITKFGEPHVSHDMNSLAALVHFMLLEHLELARCPCSLH